MLYFKNKKIKIKFNEFDIIDTNYSQADQDIFVLCCLNGKKNGTYLDLGCNDPIVISNTYLLESKFNWTGYSIDIDQNQIDKYDKIRNNKAICQDCTNIDYEKLFLNINYFDYLSLDLEPANITLECLKKIPFNKIEFSVITYEHDAYRFGDLYRDKSRNILINNGYYLLCGDVMNDNYIFEDWYVNPKYINLTLLKDIEKSKLNYYNILYY